MSDRLEIRRVRGHEYLVLDTADNDDSAVNKFRTIIGAVAAPKEIEIWEEREIWDDEFPMGLRRVRRKDLESS